MQHEQDQSGLVELGSASEDTLGAPVPSTPEDFGFHPLGLSDE